MVIGSLMFLMLGTCANIAFAVTKLAQYTANLSKDHYNKALYIIHYLIGTCKYCLVYDGNTQYGLLAYTDSDWVSRYGLAEGAPGSAAVCGTTGGARSLVQSDGVQRAPST
jgi:hypothetical protein